MLGCPVELLLAWPREPALPRDIVAATTARALGLKAEPGAAAVYVGLAAMSWSRAADDSATLVAAPRPRAQELLGAAEQNGVQWALGDLPPFWRGHQNAPLLVTVWRGHQNAPNCCGSADGAAAVERAEP